MYFLSLGVKEWLPSMTAINTFSAWHALWSRQTHLKLDRVWKVTVLSPATTFSSPGGPTSFSEYRFMTNRPPTGGRCGIDPAEGEAGTTEFTITCRGWVDSDTPLFYKAEQASGDPMNSIVLHNGPRANFPAMVLPAGHKSNGFAYDITVLISDSRGSASAVHLGVKVCFVAVP